MKDHTPLLEERARPNRDPAARGESPDCLALRERLATAIERRHEALRESAGLNEEVFDALLLLAAGGWEPAALERGHAAVAALLTQMYTGRRKRLRILGFDAERADRRSGLHTRNFM